MKPEPETEAAILAATEAGFDAFIAGDLDAMDSQIEWLPDTVIIYTGEDETTHGRRDWRSIAERASAGAEPIANTFKWRRVWQQGSVCWAAGEGVLSVRTPEGHLDLPYRFTNVLVERDGDWRSAHYHMSVGDRAQAIGEAWPRTMEVVTAAVEREQPDLRAQSAPDGMVTLLFTDIEDSTGLNERLGDIRWMHLLREHNQIVRDRVTAHEGFEVKTVGDAFMVAFRSARKAVLCAIDLRSAFEAFSREYPDDAVRIRIGLHAGEPVREADDFYGKSVTFASRVADQASGGEILVSTLVRELVESAGDISFDEPRQAALKGFAGTHAVHAVK